MNLDREKERHRLWKLANPEKVKAQYKRRHLRKKGLLPAYVRPEPLTKRDKNAARKRRLATDPEFAAAYKEKLKKDSYLRKAKLLADDKAYAEFLEKRRKRREEYRRSKGIPPRSPKKTDEERKAVAKAYYDAHKAERNEASRLRKLEARKAERIAKGLPAEPRTAMTREEYLARRREANRVKLRRERGLPDDYVFPSKSPRLSKTGERVKPATKRLTTKQRMDTERARRAAEVDRARARQLPAPNPVACPDPPALVALFKKASKGEPARPVYHGNKKRSAFQIRGWI